MTKPDSALSADYLDEASALTHAGSLLSPAGDMVASYDLEVTDAPATGFRPLSALADIRNANVATFDPDYAAHGEVHIVNGMGVTLGDSIIGLTALFAILRRYPQLRFTLYRPARAPRYVQHLYELAAASSNAFVELRDLPFPARALPADALAIDLGNHLFWPRFATLPMIDFFLWALGVTPESVPPGDKRNAWLASLERPANPWQGGEYALLCPSASTPVRSIPKRFRAALVERMWQTSGLPVAGFGPVDHPRYTDIAPHSADTAAFLGWVAHARHVVSGDSAAVHIAAGFDVPTTAFFTTIAAALRVRDYPACEAVTLALPGMQGIQASARRADIERVERAFGELDIANLRLAI